MTFQLHVYALRIFFRFVWGLLLPEKAVSLINFEPQPSPSKNLFKENKKFKVSDFIYNKYALFTRNSWRKKNVQNFDNTFT